MIDEIRRIKLEPIQEKLARKEEIQKQIESNKVEIEAISDPFDSKRHNLEIENYKLKSELFDLETLEEEKARIETATLADFGIDFQEAFKFLKDNNAEIVLTEEDKDNLYSKDKSKREYKSTDDFILVHKTDYIPEDSRIRTSKESGVQAKSEMKIGDEYYNYYYSSERDTIHFAVNAEVGDHEYGSWHNCKYAVLIPFNGIPKERMGVVAAQDTFTKGGVNLPDNAYILCPKGEKEKLQKKNPNITIIEYDGPNVSGYADALVRGLGYREESCGKWGWANKEHNQKFDEIMEKEGFEVGIPHMYSRFKKSDEEKESVHQIIAKSKLMKEKNVIKSKKDLNETYFVAQDITLESFDILVERLDTEGIRISPESRTFIHNLYELDVEEFNKENLSNGMPDTEETVQLLNRLEELKESNSQAYDRYNKTFYIRNITEYSILKEIGRENLENEKQQEIKEAEEKRQKILSKKMKDFEIKDYNNLELVNATYEESILRSNIFEESYREINKKLKEKGISKYIFCMHGTGIIIYEEETGEFQKIDDDLQGKEHYSPKHGYPKLDFKEKEDETVGEYLERLEKYTECFSRYYNGEIVDESVRFDENGEMIEESKVEKSDFEKVAESREAVSELLSGKIVREIKEEMQQQEEHTNENSVSEGEEYDQ